jgi:hypothetical protein
MPRAVARHTEQPDVDDELRQLEEFVNRLRLEYEQFFRGSMKREPFALRGKVQKMITRFMEDPPKSTLHKFKFNSLNAKYQTFRTLWGRTMREMEAGTHKSQRFQAALNEASLDEQMRLASRAEREAQTQERASKAKPGSKPAAPASAAASPLDRLYEALLAARRQTGESTDLTREKIAELVRKQTEAIRAQVGPDAKVKFRVVVEDNKAKLKGSVS